MTPENIRRMLPPGKKFHPFTVRTSSGYGYDVLSPEMFWMSPDGVLVIVYEPGKGVVMLDTDEVTECYRVVKRKKEG